MDDGTLREEFVAIAASYVDSGYADDAERFMDLVAPGETPTRQREMATLDSTCGLACRGWLGQLGLVDHRLAAPYVDGHVMEYLVAMAREAGALISVRAAQPGDLVILAAPEHALVVESIGGQIFETIQGGERDTVHGAQQIQRIARALTGSGPSLRLSGRPLEFCISLPPLAARFMP